MLKDFELAAKRHGMIKESFAALAARPLVAAAKWVAARPVKATLGALTGMEIYDGGKALANTVRKTSVDAPGTFMAGARTF